MPSEGAMNRAREALCHCCAQWNEKLHCEEPYDAPDGAIEAAASAIDAAVAEEQGRLLAASTPDEMIAAMVRSKEAGAAEERAKILAHLGAEHEEWLARALDDRLPRELAKLEGAAEERKAILAQVGALKDLNASLCLPEATTSNYAATGAVNALMSVAEWIEARGKERHD